MGANNFTETAVAKTMDEAYNRLVQDALHEYGHRYDAGTIGQTYGVRKVELPKGLSARDLDEAVMHVFHPQFLREDSERYTSRKAEHVAFRKTEWGARMTKIYKKVKADPATERLVMQLAEFCTDKGACVGVEVKGAEAKAMIDRWLQYGRPRKYVDGKMVEGPRPRGLKAFYFFGLAPS